MKSSDQSLIKKTASSGSEPPMWLKLNQSMFSYGLTFALLWLLLSQGDPSSWVIGIVVVPLATWCAMRLFQTEREGSGREGANSVFSIAATLRFIPFFLVQSIRGGWESALLAIDPKKRLYSGFIHYRARLSPGRARLFFINTISLLPGTVSASCQDDTLIIHVLDNRIDHYQALRHCENKVSTLFNISLDDDEIERSEGSIAEVPLAQKNSLAKQKSLSGERA